MLDPTAPSAWLTLGGPESRARAHGGLERSLTAGPALAIAAPARKVLRASDARCCTGTGKYVQGREARKGRAEGAGQRGVFAIASGADPQGPESASTTALAPGLAWRVLGLHHVARQVDEGVDAPRPDGLRDRGRDADRVADRDGLAGVERRPAGCRGGR